MTFSSPDHRLPWIHFFWSLTAALFLTTLPLSQLGLWLQPQWMLLILLSWSYGYPKTIGPFTAWCVGLILDFTLGGLLGLHAMVMALVTYGMYLLHLRVRTFPLWQTCVSIFLLVSFYQTLVHVIPALFNQPTWAVLLYYCSGVTSALVWPFFMLAFSKKSNRVHYI